MIALDTNILIYVCDKADLRGRRWRSALPPLRKKLELGRVENDANPACETK
jgi:hypothetical protein